MGHIRLVCFKVTLLGEKVNTTKNKVGNIVSRDIASRLCNHFCQVKATVTSFCIADIHISLSTM